MKKLVTNHEFVAACRRSAMVLSARSMVVVSCRLVHTPFLSLSYSEMRSTTVSASTRSTFMASFPPDEFDVMRYQNVSVSLFDHTGTVTRCASVTSVLLSPPSHAVKCGDCGAI